MRRFVCRSAVAVAGLALLGLAAPASAQNPTAQTAKAKPKSSPAMVLITVNDDGLCTVYPKIVTVVGKDAAPGTKGPKTVRWVYGRGNGDSSKVSIAPHPTEPKPNLFKLPKLNSTEDQGDSSEAQETVPGDEYFFRYLVTIELDGDYLDCDPKICVKTGSDSCAY